MQIWKYHLQLGRNELVMPAGAKPLSAQIQYENLTLWAMVDPAKPQQSQAFEVVGTGWDFDASSVGDFIATVQHGPLVWHVFRAPLSDAIVAATVIESTSDVGSGQ